jgi:hypothetical protein
VRYVILAFITGSPDIFIIHFLLCFGIQIFSPFGRNQPLRLCVIFIKISMIKTRQTKYYVTHVATKI